MQNANASSRLQWVDYARGIAIILVVYRHVVIGLERSGIEITDTMFNIQEFFFNFRMPVFFVLSGVFISASVKRKPVGIVLKDRASTLLYTYLLWGAITIGLQIGFSGLSNAQRGWMDLSNLLIQPRDVGHLWYLFTLFNVSWLFLLLTYLKIPSWMNYVLAVGMFSLSKLPQLEHISPVSDLFYYYLYFVAGTLISATLLNRSKEEKLLGPKNLYWLTPLFLLGQTAWFLYRDQQNEYIYILLLVNLIACYFVYVVSFALSESRSVGWLAYLGKFSLYIYILHIFVASATRSAFVYLFPSINLWLLVAICCMTGLLVPVVLYNLFKGYGADKLFSLKLKRAT